MWVHCWNPDDLTCISRKDHLFCIPVLILSIHGNQCYFLKLLLIFLSMTRSNTRSALFSTSLNSLTSYKIEQSISFWAETPFTGCFLKVSTISRSHLGLTGWARVLTKMCHEHFFSRKRKLPKLSCFTGCSLWMMTTAFTKTF